MAEENIAERDRRAEPRAQTSLVAVLKDGDSEVPVVVLDVSTTGALVKVSEPIHLEAGEELAFKVYGTEYRAEVQVVREVEDSDAYLYSCRLLLPDEEAPRFHQAVDAALGRAATYVRPWADVLQDIGRRGPDATVVAGFTPAGRAIEATGRDCLEMGAAGVELFVQTVGSIEPM